MAKAPIDFAFFEAKSMLPRILSVSKLWKVCLVALCLLDHPAQKRDPPFAAPHAGRKMAILSFRPS
ncbi:hypothetical protein [Beijerinckia indica]|uniref:hypothetical protein n=1 Tax=Beijerinckia indica TaxID=533 RepID=UPI0011D0BCB6|nr:hypothetical protein [Beijerinckia indica]